MFPHGLASWDVRHTAASSLFVQCMHLALYCMCLLRASGCKRKRTLPYLQRPRSFEASHGSCVCMDHAHRATGRCCTSTACEAEQTSRNPDCRHSRRPYGVRPVRAKGTISQPVLAQRTNTAGASFSVSSTCVSFDIVVMHAANCMFPT